MTTDKNPKLILYYKGLKQGPRAACGPSGVIVRPAFIWKTSDMLNFDQIYLNLRAFISFVAHGMFFPLNWARGSFFIWMWPSYQYEFETPALLQETTLQKHVEVT